MRSREGAELAVRAWRDTVTPLADAALLPVEPAARRVALETVQSLAGFWVMWHLEGGFEGLRRIGYSEATIRKRCDELGVTAADMTALATTSVRLDYDAGTVIAA